MIRIAMTLGLALAGILGCGGNRPATAPTEAPTASAAPAAAPAVCAGLGESQCKITEGCGWSADGAACVEQKKGPLQP